MEVQVHINISLCVERGLHIFFVRTLFEPYSKY